MQKLFQFLEEQTPNFFLKMLPKNKFKMADKFYMTAKTKFACYKKNSGLF
jgi:hypothetical protein